MDEVASVGAVRPAMEAAASPLAGLCGDSRRTMASMSRARNKGDCSRRGTENLGQGLTLVYLSAQRKRFW